METTRGYRDLRVWQRSIDLSLSVYQLTRVFPKDETYGLASQMRRASVSIPSNIAEGQAKRSLPEFKRFLSIALGSLAEIDTQLIIAARLKYIDPQQGTACEKDISEIRAMLFSLMSNAKF